MKTYEVRLYDGGRWYWDVVVQANDVDEACKLAKKKAHEEMSAYHIYEDDGTGKPDYIEEIIANGEGVKVPQEYAKPSDNLYKAAIDYASLFIEQKRGEEALIALENIPGLKGLGDLVRGVR